MLSTDVKTVSKFAQIEFKFSSPEHGRTIMTGLLANYPRRFDLWSVFLDLEIKQGEPDVIRYVLLKAMLKIDDYSRGCWLPKCQRKRPNSFSRNGYNGRRRVVTRMV